MLAMPCWWGLLKLKVKQNADQTYAKHWKHSEGENQCKGGLGGSWLNDVYQLRRKASIQPRVLFKFHFEKVIAVIHNAGAWMCGSLLVNYTVLVLCSVGITFNIVCTDKA